MTLEILFPFVSVGQRCQGIDCLHDIESRLGVFPRFAVPLEHLNSFVDDGGFDGVETGVDEVLDGVIAAQG